MRVLMVDSEESWRGGEAQLELLLRGLLEGGYELVLASPPASQIAKKASGLGVRVFSLSTSGGLDIAAALRLRRFLEGQPFDIVHSHSSHAHSISFLATRGMDPRPRLVVSRRVDFPVARSPWSALKYRFGADLYLSISEGVASVLAKGGVAREKIRVIPSGIDLDKFRSLKDNAYVLRELKLGGSSPVVGNVAALVPHKAQVDFIRAAKIIAEALGRVKFVIVGEGRLRPRLEPLAEGLGLGGCVIFTGFRSDVLEILSTFDCFVLSSRLEGLCTSIMDAQALGIPVVATRTGGIPELVEDGATGLLVPPRNPELLARAVMTMLYDGALRERCVSKARKKVASYDYKRMVEGTARAYAELLSG